MKKNNKSRNYIQFISLYNVYRRGKYKKYIKYILGAILTIIIVVIIVIVVNNNNKTSSSNQKENNREIINNDITIDDKINNNNDNVQENKSVLVLFGSETITLNNGENYVKPGFYSLNEEGIINTSSVKVTNNVNVNKSGTYKITYKYKDIVKERKVIVLEKDIQDEGTLTINLIGDKNITLEKGQDYHEPGCNAFYNKINLSNKITTESDLNINKVGTYRIKYTIIHNNQKKEVTRIITVIDNSLKIILASQSPNYTNQNVNINITVNGDAFSYIKLPDNKIVNDNKTTYMVDINGTYTFKAYNINNQEFTESITIQNIDKIPPTGTCQATINKQNTNIIVAANDNNNSLKYTYIDKNNTLRIFTDLKASSIDEINNKKTWTESVINSGIRNTFTFAAPLITNGQVSNDSTNMPSPSTKKNRQAICQVNDNNFVLITGKDLNRPKLIDIMLGLNCKTGTNLDGGGSIALLFKNKVTSKITTIIGNERELSEVGYFTE